MEESTGRWVPVAQVDPNTTDFKIEGLTKGKKYKFRVKAVNAQGESEPLENDGFIEAKNPYNGRIIKLSCGLCHSNCFCLSFCSGAQSRISQVSYR